MNTSRLPSSANAALVLVDGVVVFQSSSENVISASHSASRSVEVVFQNRALHYGDGLFETVLVLDGEPILYQQHLQRLLRDAEKLNLSVDALSLQAELCQCLSYLTSCSSKASRTGVLKIMLGRESQGRGYRAGQKSTTTRLLMFYEGLSYPASYWQGVSVALAQYRLPYNRALAGIKHLNRLDQVLASQERSDTNAELLLQGLKGELIEGSFSNVFLVKQQQLYTPDLTLAGVKGIMRDYLIHELAPSLKLTVNVKRLCIDDLAQADEVFVCNSVFGVWPVNNVGLLRCGEGLITRKVQAALSTLGYERLYGQ